jgi:catechol 2,3-dioxygenase-like lactoylglutathione lyase family enzyme
MIKTYGLTHLSISVSDIHRSATFYENVFGSVKMYVNEKFIQLQTPGSHDVIVLDQSNDELKTHTGVKHFGFRLIDPTDIKVLISEIEKAGGKIKESGEFCPGEPYVFFYDPDGYEIEVWYEKSLKGFS